MNVVLEGPDNAGKSTLAQRLLKQVPGSSYYHPGGKPDSDAAELMFIHEQADLLKHKNQMILDRITPISQQVYNPNPEADIIRMTHLNRLMLADNFVVIYCRPKNEILMDVGNFKWRPEEPEEHRQKIITQAHTFVERYDTLMLKVPNIFYDWQDSAHANIIETKLVQAMCGDIMAQIWFHQVIQRGSGK